jgi:hypothetical protein
MHSGIMPAPMSNRSPRLGPFRTPLQIFLVLFAVYAITAPGGFEVTDGETRFETAKSWLQGSGGALPPAMTHAGVLAPNGHYYSFYGPLQSVLMTPVVAVARRLSHGSPDHLSKLMFGVLAIPFVSALSMAVLFKALRAFDYSERIAFATSALIGLATPMWHYGRSGQEENIIGLALGLYLWGMARLFHDRFDGLSLVGLAASIVVATRWSYLPTLALILIPIAVMLWQRRAEWHRWWRSLAVCSAVGLSVLGCVLWYNVYRFGRPFETGYGLFFKVHPPFFTFGAAPSHAAALLVSPYRGLLWFCPVLLMLFGLRTIRVNEAIRRLWLPTLAAWVFTWLFIASFSVWNAGPAWGPRYLVAPIVLLAPMFAAVLASAQRWRGIIAVSFLVQILSTVLPSSSEDFLYATRNMATPGTCTPWSCGCSALCLRAPWALRAIGNTLSSRPLPVVDLAPSATAPGGLSMLDTSDFNSVYWWPVRAAYRAHILNPAFAFALCLTVLAAAFSALLACYRRLPLEPSNDDAAKLLARPS